MPGFMKTWKGGMDTVYVGQGKNTGKMYSTSLAAKGYKIPKKKKPSAFPIVAVSSVSHVSGGRSKNATICTFKGRQLRKGKPGLHECRKGGRYGK